MDHLFDAVHSRLQGQPNRRGFYNCDCPFCGKEAKSGQNHFGYNEQSYKCFVCGACGGIVQLANHLRLDTQTYTPIVRLPEPDLQTRCALARAYPGTRGPMILCYMPTKGV